MTHRPSAARLIVASALHGVRAWVSSPAGQSTVQVTFIVVRARWTCPIWGNTTQVTRVARFFTAATLAAATLLALGDVGETGVGIGAIKQGDVEEEPHPFYDDDWDWD